jgi:hypothetical protein
MQKLSGSLVGAAFGSPGVTSPSPGGGGLESPSLFVAGEAQPNAPAAYELKFLLTEDQAQAATDRIRERLALDSHADPALGGAYRTTSLYTDTPQFDVFYRNGDYATSKYRVRRYGGGGSVFLERKDKDGNRVRKCRATVPADDLPILARAKSPTDWVGGWFRKQVADRELAPVCRISYERVAFMGATDGGAVRVTFDRNIRGESAVGWELRPVGTVPELLPGFVVCEFKFRVALPAMLKEIVESLALAPTTVSKYRRFVRAAGLAGEPDPGEPGASATGEGEPGASATGCSKSGSAGNG